jgi:hypothetical protein
MNTPEPIPDPMPSYFGPKYLFWIACRWVYFNPLTILSTLQIMAMQLDSAYPTLRWLGTTSAAIGVLIAQVRNKGTNYMVPVAQSNLVKAAATVAASSTTPATPASPQGTPK